MSLAEEYLSSMKFVKYHGAGNDFLLVNQHRSGPHFRDAAQAIEQACTRHTGIGADGLIFWVVEMNQPPRMIYYNADGQPSSFCGNGARCFVRCLLDEGVLSVGQTFSFRANDGMHTGTNLASGDVEISMLIAGGVDDHGDNAQLVDTGSPHYLRWCSVLPEGDIVNEARTIRYSSAFAKTGINVNYVAELPDNTRLSPKLTLRTYERGVETETLACGTGVTAAALGYAEREQLTGEIKISVKAVGGQLSVRFTRAASGAISDVYLTGPAVRVYTGEWPLPGES